ncbi:GNAT family N-acetyltransferase [Ruegeria sp. R13_0]|uniref:GNAT family N-acetyltransferase n=1 Tax=Ruegeria sp. R13_0 TaxID=2821099 RepID=UPI001ADA6077|nr:GNAT family N-acetyltransferase [Ruegeria sp. R13_0]MBO9437001.1 GNAT family N-acetyltransferase [Ruegeria sp. R13_0]
MTKPTLPFDGGRLRPVTHADADLMLALMTGPEVRRYLCDDTILTPDDVAGFVSASIGQDEDGLGLWVIETETETTAGLLGLMPVSGPLVAVPAMRGGIEPTIALDPRFWGRGLARQALLAVIEYGRTELSLTELVAAVDAPNESSHRLMQTCGFEECGTTSGTAHDLILYKRLLTQGAAS